MGQRPGSTEDGGGAPAPSATAQAVGAWRSTLGQAVSGLLVFEIATGLLIWLLPFSLSSQFMVLAHTAAGVAFMVPYAWWQTRHWLDSRARPFTHLKVTGWVSLGATVACAGTGVWLTAEAAFGRRISPLADLLHIGTGLFVLGIVAVHIGSVIARDRRRSAAPGAAELVRARRSWYARTAAVALLLGAGTAAWQASYAPPDLSWSLPENYGFAYGKDRPFAPSLATTPDGGPLHPRTLAGSKGCGASGCHEQIYEEWQPSAHRYASIDIGFQAVQKVMAENEGPESTRYCAGCHDPVALFSGSKNIYDDDLSSPGAEEGVSCVSCHRLLRTDVKGNASFVMAPPDWYAYELDDGPVAEALAHFLIRAYPRHHAGQYAPPLLREPEYCGACHKQFIDEEINDFGWVQLQNQYDNWRKSHWNREGDPAEASCAACHERKGVAPPSGEEGRCPAITVSCRECHMRLSDSADPAAGDASDLYRDAADGKHRNHRFIGANQFIPPLQKLPGWEEQVRLTEEWLRGDAVLPEIAHKWPAPAKEWVESASRRPEPDPRPSGPVVPIKLRARTPSVRPGGTLEYTVEIASRKVGHDFPTGPLDIIQCWVETEVTDASGAVIHHSGRLNEGHFVEEGSFVFKAEGVDAKGNLIDRHNLWELVGARFKRALFPGFTDTAEYRVPCPAQSGPPPKLPESEDHRAGVAGGIQGPLRVHAKLLYRKVNQHLLNVITGRKDIAAPVTVMATDTITVPVDG